MMSFEDKWGIPSDTTSDSPTNGMDAFLSRQSVFGAEDPDRATAVDSADEAAAGGKWATFVVDHDLENGVDPNEAYSSALRDPRLIGIAPEARQRIAENSTI